MKAQIGTVIVASIIILLFRFARNRQARTSSALWIAILWFAIGASRNLSEWLRFSSPNESERYMEGNPLDRAFLSALLAAGVIVLLMRQKKVGSVLRASWPILLYFGFCGISSVWSDFPDVSAKRWIRSLGDVVMALIVLTDRDWLAAMKRFFSRVAFVLLPLSMLFIYYFPTLGRTYSKGGRPAWTGVTTDKNALGMICLIFGLASLWQLIQIFRGPRKSRNRRLVVAHASTAVLAIWLLVKANSATALACCILAGCILVVTSLSSFARRPGVVHVMVIGAISVVISSMFLNTGSGLVETLGRDNTFTGRTEIWSAALPLIPNSFVGAGFESFWLGERHQTVEHIINQTINEAHNGYIEVFLNLGWAGVVMLGILLISGYCNVVAAVRRQEDAATLRLAYFVSAVLYNVSEAGFKMMHPLWITLLVSILVAPRVLSNPTLLARRSSRATALAPAGIRV